jgi:hypothetical protein
MCTMRQISAGVSYNIDEVVLEPPGALMSDILVNVVETWNEKAAANRRTSTAGGSIGLQRMILPTNMSSVVGVAGSFNMPHTFVTVESDPTKSPSQDLAETADPYDLPANERAAARRSGPR